MEEEDADNKISTSSGAGNYLIKTYATDKAIARAYREVKGMKQAPDMTEETFCGADKR